MITRSDIHRFDLGHFLRGADETGTGAPQMEAVLGYLVTHPRGLVLFDTGVGVADPETEARYPTRRRPLVDALRGAGAMPAEVRLVVNCHLHVDHCGGNPLFRGRPIIAQREELAAAQEPGYTLAELIDFPGARYEAIDGEVELLPGIWIVPTPGHTPGHQSLVVRCDDGTVILAGQSHHLASDYSADQLAWSARSVQEYRSIPPPPVWLDRLQSFDPARVMFAHDLSIWEPIRG